MFTLSPHSDLELIFGFIHKALFATILGNHQKPLYTKHHGWETERRRI